MDENPRKPSALIVEDNDSLIDIFAQAMATAGFAIETASNGLEAYDKLGASEPSVIILDIYLPGITGDKILAHIRNDVRLRSAKVVLSTFDSLLAEKFRDQCDFVLLKPVSYTQMRDLGIRLRSELIEPK